MSETQAKNNAQQPNLNQRIVLSLGDLQQVLNYLATRPYSEVFNVIETVKKARTLESVATEEGYIKLPPVLQNEEKSTQTVEA